jgi:hypothetical protein
VTESTASARSFGQQSPAEPARMLTRRERTPWVRSIAPMRSGLFVPIFDALADPALVARLSAEAEEAGCGCASCPGTRRS